MKKLLAAMICTLPFAVGGNVYAQVDPSLVNAAPQSQGDTVRQDQAAGTAQQDNSATGNERSTGAGTNGSQTSDRTGTSETDTNTRGSADSMTSVAPSESASRSTIEPSEGHNKSGNGDAAGTQPRAQDGQGAR